MAFTELHLQNPVLLRSPSSQTVQSFLTRQISKCYFTAILKPRPMYLSGCGSDFATAGLKEIQMISSLTHSTEQTTRIFDSASFFLDVKISVQWTRRGQKKWPQSNCSKGFLMAPPGSKEVKEWHAHYVFLFLKLSHVEFHHIRVKSMVMCSKLLIADEKINAQCDSCPEFALIHIL